MSDSKDIKASSPNGASRRKERERRETRDRKKTRLISIVVVVVLVVCLCGALFINSGYIRNNFTAIDVGGVKFSAAEYSYFYNSSRYVYQNEVYAAYSTVPELAQSMLPNASLPLNSQIQDPVSGATWADFFETRTFTNLSEMVPIYLAAVDAGYEMPEEEKAAMEYSITSVQESGFIMGYSDFGRYLKYLYGPSMTEKAFRKAAEFEYMTNSYGAHIFQSFTYTVDELAAYYAENADTLDTFELRSILVNAEAVSEDDYESTAEYDVAKAGALAAASALAQSIAEEAGSEEAFIAAAKAYDEVKYETEASTFLRNRGDALNDTYAEWIKSAERKPGDVSIFETINAFYVVRFTGRVPNDYSLVNMRRLVQLPNTVNQSDYTDDADGYEKALEEARVNVKERAELLFNAFEAGGPTEDKFIATVNENSAENVADGLYENVFKWQTTDVINDWLFDPARVYGEYALFDAGADGYQIVYFTGLGMRYCDKLAEDGLKKVDLEDWYASFPPAVIKTTWLFSLAD